MDQPIKRIIKFLISLVFFSLEQLISFVIFLFTRRKKHFCLILLYHSIPASLREKFIKQIAALKRLGRFIAPEELSTYRGDENCFLLTFDDAYRSVIEHALPELSRHHIPVTVFVPVDNLGQKPAWLKDSGHMDEHEVIASLADLQKVDYPLLTFGSHSLSHANLALLDDSRLKQELYDSKARLEQMFHQPIFLLAYPGGFQSEQVLASAKAAGYTMAFTTSEQFYKKELDQLKLGRVVVCPRFNWAEFMLKIRGAYRWLPWFSGFKQRILKTEKR